LSFICYSPSSDKKVIKINGKQEVLGFCFPINLQFSNLIFNFNPFFIKNNIYFLQFKSYKNTIYCKITWYLKMKKKKLTCQICIIASMYFVMNSLNRYRKQILLKEIGKAGQKKLCNSFVVVAGCGALGSVIANSLARAGVGKIRIIDRDFIEEDNLQRQILFDEEDIHNKLPKAIAASKKLAKINSNIQIDPIVDDINPQNIESLIDGANLVLDGTDNFETRFLINDACIKNKVPWIYGGVTGTYGMSLTIIPNETPCFRCFIKECPKPGIIETCDTAGILSTAVNIIASIEVTEALKLLTGQKNALLGGLINIDIWEGRWRLTNINKNNNTCPTCGMQVYDFLKKKNTSKLEVLCGRMAIQITPSEKYSCSFHELSKRLETLGEVNSNNYMLQVKIDKYEITVFKDGRTIIKGTSDSKIARSLYSKYIGN
jgi:adenylyltransferase/sulfurtransferase